jgi:hypothetical protein
MEKPEPIPYDDYDFDDEYVDDDDDYCNCGAMHDDTELGGICSACGKLVD